MKIEADREVCIGAGMCVLTAPTCFDQDDDGTVVVLQVDVPEGDERRIRNAVDSCPSGALSVVD